MTLNDIKRVCTAKTKAILNVHTYGLPSEIKEIKYCLKNNIYLIEDSAEAHGINMKINIVEPMEIFLLLVFMLTNTLLLEKVEL